ncbi:MAG: hypothetical protein II937_03315 [Bacteroidales bacterium]|nr:hypothetical protein [Bacteroidales bacterium]
MKKKFLLVSMIAAAMLTASCSKEDNGDNSEQPVNVEQQIVQQTRPIVIKVDKRNPLSKVGTSDGYVLTFSADDKLVLTDGRTQYAELDLQAEDAGKSTATFTGNISTDADGKEIYATAGSPLTSVQTSSTSLADVVAANCYLKSASFTYSQESELNVELSDQNAYLVFSVAEGQKKVNIGDGWYPTDGDIVNKTLYVAVSAGDISGRFFGTKTLAASKIYTITRTDVVDLGPDFSVLWKYQIELLTSNGQYRANWENTCSNFGTITNLKEGSDFRIPTKNELEKFINMSNERDADGVLYAYNDYASIYWHAVGIGTGYRQFSTVWSIGAYWSSDVVDGESKAYVLWVNYLNDEDPTISVKDYSVDEICTVRLVRDLY